MKVVPFVEVSPEQWDECCDQSSDAWLFHRSTWVDIEANFFVGDNLSFALIDGGSVVGVQPLYFSELSIGWVERLLHCGIHRHTGLAVLDNLSSSSIKTARSIAMQHIYSLAQKYSADRIQLNCQNLAPGNLSQRRHEIPFWVENEGFFLGMNFGVNGMIPAPGLSVCCADQVVSLFEDNAIIFSQLEESCRRAIRKAERHGLSIEINASVDEYYSLAELASMRTGESLAQREYFAMAKEKLGVSGKIAFLMVRHQGKPAAAIFLGIDKGAASYLGGVSDPRFLPIRVNEFLQWHTILCAKSMGLQYYRMGPFFPEIPKEWAISKVSRFKTKFGGRSVTTIQGSCFLNPEKYLQNGLDHINNLIDALAVTKTK